MASLGPGIAVNDLVKKDVNRQVHRQLCFPGSQAEEKSPLVQAFWKYLLLCFETPRPSTDYCEPDTFSRLDKIRGALSHVATNLGAAVVEDAAGNLIIRREGRGSGANKASLCFQGHLDMVVSQNEGAEHDFENDAIEVCFSSDDGIVDGWLKPVKATTLGADNGVALAASLALLEVLDNHPPLELLFTSNEETNFFGAENLLPGTLKSKQLLNLDSEDEYTIVLGSAGVFEHHYKLPIEREHSKPLGLCTISVKLAGLHGGHSGVDINKEYGNANKLIARLMLLASKADDGVRLVSFSGGSGPTAISREASCIVLVPKDSATSFCDELSEHFAKVQDECKMDPAMELTLAVCSEDAPDLAASAPMPAAAIPDAAADMPPTLEMPPMPLLGTLQSRNATQSAQRQAPKKKRLLMDAWQCSRCDKCVAKAIASGSDIGAAERTAKMVKRSDLAPLTPDSTKKIWQFCCSLPNGVLHMSTKVDGLVDSSVNFGVVTLMDDHLFCHLCVRSSVSTFLESYQKVLSAFGQLAKATNVENICPGSPWQPKFDSNLLEVLKHTHTEEFHGKEPHVTVLHAGLEPGILMDSHPDLDCCSIGPQIQNAHSPDERVNVASAERFVQWLKRLLETLAQKE